MYIKVKEIDGLVNYLNLDQYQNFEVEKDRVIGWTLDNRSIYIEKTKELNDQLNSLLPAKTSKGFEKFE